MQLVLRKKSLRTRARMRISISGRPKSCRICCPVVAMSPLCYVSLYLMSMESLSCKVGHLQLWYLLPMLVLRSEVFVLVVVLQNGLSYITVKNCPMFGEFQAAGVEYGQGRNELVLYMLLGFQDRYVSTQG